MPGAYILLARPDITFQYPKGMSSIFYSGKSENLRRRIREHYSLSCKLKTRLDDDSYRDRYQYMTRLGGRYTFLETSWKELPEWLETDLMGYFEITNYVWCPRNYRNYGSIIIGSVDTHLNIRPYPAF